MAEDPKEMVRRGYDAVSYAYRGDRIDEVTERQYANWISRLTANVPLGGDVLELGCGCGLPAARLLAEKYHVIGVDISPVQIKRARKLVAGATFYCADMATFAMPAAAFHAIVSFYAIIHLPIAEQPKLIGDIATALRPGGMLLLIAGHQAWTGIATDWLDVAGATMFWSHENAEAYCRWIKDAELTVQSCEFVVEGKSGHSLILANKP